MESRFENGSSGRRGLYFIGQYRIQYRSSGRVVIMGGGISWGCFRQGQGSALIVHGGELRSGSGSGLMNDRW
jgi:hypothetical protein